MQPTHEELIRVFQAGFQSIDEGDMFYTGFYERLGSPVTCDQCSPPSSLAHIFSEAVPPKMENEFPQSCNDMASKADW